MRIFEATSLGLLNGRKMVLGSLLAKIHMLMEGWCGAVSAGWEAGEAEEERRTLGRERAVNCCACRESESALPNMMTKCFIPYLTLIITLLPYLRNHIFTRKILKEVSF